jgi:hypothetical protein
MQRGRGSSGPFSISWLHWRHYGVPVSSGKELDPSHVVKPTCTPEGHCPSRRGAYETFPSRQWLRIGGSRLMFKQVSCLLAEQKSKERIVCKYILIISTSHRRADDRPTAGAGSALIVQRYTMAVESMLVRLGAATVVRVLPDFVSRNST